MERGGSAATPVIFAVVAAVVLAGAGALLLSKPSSPPAASGAGLAVSTEGRFTAGGSEVDQAREAAANARLGCEVTEGRLLGPGVFEVACRSAPGYVVFNRDSGAVDAYDCDTMRLGAALDGKGAPVPARQCGLAGNADFKANLAHPVAASGTPCVITAARGLAHQTVTSHYFELACAARPGLVLEIPRSGKPMAQSCLDYDGGADACKLTSRAELMAWLGKFAAKGGRTCAVSRFRYDGYAGTDLLYEVACGGKRGFVVETDPHGGFRKILSCAQTRGTLGACTL